MDTGPVSSDSDSGQDPCQRVWKYARTLLSPKWDRGLYLFPLHHVVGLLADGSLVCSCGNRRCPSAGKHPRFTDWQGAASNDRATIDRWWNVEDGEYRGANIGLSCERSGIVVLDADRHTPGQDGLDTIRQLETIIGPLPTTWTIQTGGASGAPGLQYYFDLCLEPGDEYPTLVKTLDQLGIGPGVDVQGKGKLVVAPGSMTRDLYRFMEGEDGYNPFSNDTPDRFRHRPARIPDALLEILKRPAVPPRGAGTGPARDTLLGHLAAAANLIRQDLPGDKLAIYCPWSRAAGFADGHDEGSPSSTVLMPACEGSRLGGWNCFHTKCSRRTVDDFRKLFTTPDRWPDAPRWLADADRALDEQGIEPRSRRSQRSQPSEDPDPAEHTAGPDMMPGSNGGPPEVHKALVAAGVRFTITGKGADKTFHLDHSTGNLAQFFRAHPEFAGLFRLDTAAMRVVCARALPALAPPSPPWPAAGEPFETHHMTVLAHYLETMWCTKNLALHKTAPLPMALNAVAAEHQFNPITEWLLGLPAWDETPRLATWVEDILGVDDAVCARMGYRWLLQVINRALHPGAKADAILILEGKQGIGKNRLIAAMNAPFPAVQVSISLDKSDEVARRCRGSLIPELPELAAIRGVATEKYKEFISATADTMRTFYTESIVTYPRTFSFIGTTNQHTYLTDHTGNRRFLCITCPGPIAVERFVAMRDMLYAEAIALVRAGEPYWIAGDEAEAFEDHATRRLAIHPWQNVIADWCRDHPNARALRSIDILEHIVRVPTERKNPAHYVTIAACMTALTWREHKHLGRTGHADSGSRGWYLPDPDPDNLDLGPDDPYDFSAHVADRRDGFPPRDW